MKKKQFLVFVSIILCFLTFSGFFKSRQEKYIEAGDKALMQNKFDVAYSNYRKAGDAARDKLKDAYIREINYYRSKRTYTTNQRDMDDVLDDIEKEEKDQRLYTEVLLEMIATLRSEKNRSDQVYSLIDRIPDACRSEGDAIRKQLEEEERRAREENLERAIKNANSSSNSYHWESVLDDCRAIPEYETARKILKNYEAVVKNPCPETAKNVSRNLWNYATEDYVPKNLDQVILFHMGTETANGRYHPDKPDTETLGEFYDPNRAAVFFGIDETEEAETLTDSMVEELKATCGKAAEGKILIIHDRAQYDSKEREIDIVWHLMRKLPDSRRPEDVREVKYLFHLKSDYTKGGTYSGGTRQIIEKTKLSLYDTETGRVIFTKTVSGKRSDIMYYYDRKPVYYSAESPDMCAAFRDAMKKISNQ